MTEEEQKLLEETVKEVAEKFGVNFQILKCIGKYKQHKKIVIEYAQQIRQSN